MRHLSLLASVALFALFGVPALAQTDGQSSPAQGSNAETVVVTAKRLGEARTSIQTQIGASTYTITASDIENQPGGESVQLNQVILQMPDVAQDSYGQFHIR